MRRLWHRLYSVPSQTKCIYCNALSRNVLPSLLSRAPPLFPLALFQSYSSSSSSSSSSNNKSSNNGTSMTEILTLKTNMNVTSDVQDPDVAMRRNKAIVLADFYRSLSTQDIDQIWPLYTYLYHNDYLNCLTRKNYHNLFLYTIRSRATTKNLHRLKALVDDMKQQGYSLRLSEYNSLINWIGGKTVIRKQPHHLIDTLQLLDEMQQSYIIDETTGKKIEKDVIQPNLTTFNSLIHIAAQLLDLRTAQKLYHDMISRGLQPNMYTYSTLLHAMGKIGDVDGIDCMVAEVKAKRPKKLLDTAAFWNVVMAGYARNGFSDRACDLFEQMLENVKRKRKTPSKKTGPVADGETFRIYIDLMVHSGKRNEAIAMLYSMKDVNVQPTISIYNTLFSTFMSPAPIFKEEIDASNFHDNEDLERKANLDTLDKLYQHMKNNQVKPNSKTMYTLVSAFLDLGDTNSALEAFVSLSTVNKSTENPSVRACSVSKLSKNRLLNTRSKWEALTVEPTPELIERLNGILAKSDVK
ncbi:hypothetical protein [Parasitella parasitica]|uniref:Pentacotripeptide-repeat region of PRORP domain-containing protein n=1 Tax=Parasitella parasitica TaxID=35722 RepID=A0A0B7NM36_9FUNG|nr:hypothetical protein [Parasitella parasitica]